MRAGMWWMAVGIAAVAWLPFLLPPIFLTGAVCAGSIAALALRRYARGAVARHLGIALIALALGLAWGSAYGYHIRSGLLPVALEKQSLLLRGHIDGLVEQRDGSARFDRATLPVLRFQFAVDRQHSGAAHLPRRIQLNWYAAGPFTAAGRAPRPGEYWQLRVKLRRPRGFANPGGFDYEAWLVANRIGATGYVQSGADNRRLAPAPRWSIDAVRGRAQRYLQRHLQAYAHRDLLLGLLLGDGGAITSAEWDTFRATGTVHLFVVSGLQIAFTGGLVLWFARLWWRSPWCASRRRNYAIGVAPAFLLASVYAVLAGWGVPIQRALIMFAVIVWALIARRQMRAATAWITALWLVLLCDPLAVRAIGFWFSFIAVAAILAIVCGHREAPTLFLLRSGRRWWRVQWALFATSVPLLLLLSGQLTLLALPANIVAIPLSTFISLPLAFLALLGDAVAPGASAWLWRGADLSLDWLWRYLLWLQQHGAVAIWHPPGIDMAVCAFAVLAAALLLLPRGIPGRAFAAILLVPLGAPPLATIARGDCRVTVIDVGQGLSVLVETARHRLLYDTGPVFGSGRTAAELTAVPLLRRRGIAALDTVVVSHNDSDHAGGWPAIARAFSVQRLLLGEDLAPADAATDIAANGTAAHAEYCSAGMHWRWDGVDFDVLYPPAGIPRRSDARGLSDNDHSCVLQISSGGARILLTGDIERDAEYALLDNPALRPATLLLAPHHGSRSSSTTALVTHEHPAYVVFSTGYRNRFRHPSATIVRRYRRHGATLFNTAYDGAVTFTFARGSVTQIVRQRSRLRHYWD